MVGQPQRAGGALLCVLAGLRSAEAATSHNITYFSTSRFPLEGVGSTATPTFEACVTPPLPPPGNVPGAAGNGILFADLGQPGNAITFPGFRVGGSSLGDGQLPIAPNGTAGCYTITPGVMASAGPALLQIFSNGSGTNRAKVEYYESVSVAFGLRPYISEAEGTLLLRPDRGLIAAVAAASTSDSSATVVVKMTLPFAEPPRTVTWDATTLPSLLQQPEQVLSFSFAGAQIQHFIVRATPSMFSHAVSDVATLNDLVAGLPVLINQDVEITFTLPDGGTFTKWRRLMRATPLPVNSSVLAVQVDHSTSSLLVDGRLHAGSGFYYSGNYHGTGFLSHRNFSEYVVKSATPNRLNEGMVYRLHLYTPKEQLEILDELAAVNFKVLYEMPQMDNCNGSASPDQETSCLLHHDTTSPGYQLLNDTVHLIKHHPALLGYYICDDCCKNNRGATRMAISYNIIKRMDPYHIIAGASDCSGTWVFGDSQASCLAWQNEKSSPSGPGPTGCGTAGCVCEKPSTTDTSLAMIPYGEQPHQQLSLDYILQENYEGGLWRHSGDGHWEQGFIGPDGTNHAENPFEPIANCPECCTAGSVNPDLYSQAWLGAIQSGMYDLVVFTGPQNEAVVAATAVIAEQFQELRPGFCQRFGSAYSATVNVEEVLPATDCFDQRLPDPAPDPEGWRNPYWPGGRLRGKVYAEAPVVSGQVCAHLVVVNLQIESATAFHATLGGRAFSAFVNMTAARMFARGAALTVSGDGVISDWIAPGATNVYRLGNCTPPMQPATNIASPPIVHVGPAGGLTVATANGVWGPASWISVDGNGDYEPGLSVMTDTAVALAPSRHSLRLNIPTTRATVIAFPGKQLVPPSTSGWCGAAWGCKVAQPGQRVVGASTTLPAGKSFHVSLQVQASPCGTTVELMRGDWVVNSSNTKEAEQSITAVYDGSPIATVAPCGTNWTTLQTVVNGSAHTALQLRLTPLPTVRNYGAQVWVGGATIVAL